MVVVPLPVVVAPPGLAVTVQVPVAGSPLSATLPVATLQVGWVIAPMPGAVGVRGWALITTDPEGGEIHPSAFSTV